MKTKCQEDNLDNLEVHGLETKIINKLKFSKDITKKKSYKVKKMKKDKY